MVWGTCSLFFHANLNPLYRHHLYRNPDCWTHNILTGAEPKLGSCDCLNGSSSYSVTENLGANRFIRMIQMIAKYPHEFAMTKGDGKQPFPSSNKPATKVGNAAQVEVLKTQTWSQCLDQLETFRAIQVIAHSLILFLSSRSN